MKHGNSPKHVRIGQTRLIFFPPSSHANMNTVIKPVEVEQQYRHAGECVDLKLVKIRIHLYEQCPLLFDSVLS